MKAIVGSVPANSIIQSVETLGTASPYIGEVHYNTPTGPTPTGPGGISSHSPQSIYVIENNVNLAGHKINSTDIDIEYTKKVVGVGRFDITSVWTWYNSYEEELIPTEPYYQYAGYASTMRAPFRNGARYTTLDLQQRASTPSSA
jgi:iron complex outermembrane recepter protein